MYKIKDSDDINIRYGCRFILSETKIFGCVLYFIFTYLYIILD